MRASRLRIGTDQWTLRNSPTERAASSRPPRPLPSATFTSASHLSTCSRALLDDEEGAAAGLIKAAGGDPVVARTAVEGELGRQPKVQGAGRRPAAAHRRDRPRAGCCPAGRDKGRRRVRGPDRLLLALAASDSPAARALRQAGATAQALDRAVADIRKGRKVTSQNAEATFDALKKYARDVTALAQQGKLDPVIGRDEEIRRAIQVLARRTKNNPC